MFQDGQYIEYEQRVLDLLKKRIMNDNEGNVIKTNFPYKRRGSDGTDMVFVFDLVELNHNGKILKVYEICSPSAYRRNLNSIQKKLLVYEKITNAATYLVYMTNNGRLSIMSLTMINAKVLSSKELNKNSLSVPVSVSSFSEYYSIIEKLCKEKWGDLRFFFRGQPNIKYEPIPSIYRNGNIAKEDGLYHEAIRRMPAEFTEDMSTFDKLVKMQHYGLPTRLLDVTTNPLVALYFACQEDDNADGEVLVYSMLQNQIKYYDSDSVCLLANLAKRPINFDFNTEKVYLLLDVKKDKFSFYGTEIVLDTIKDVLCVLPKLNNDRITNQDGAFFIFGIGEAKAQPASLPDPPSKIGIKASAKMKILKELKFLGFDESSMFPETDKIMKQIKEEYCGI